jgi:hypothetical protein
MVETGLVAVIGAALLVGAYQHGKMTERKWWRSELASKSDAVRATIARLGTEAENLDAALIREIEGAHAKLDDAESTIRRIKASPTPVVAADDACRPVPASCLLRPR